MTDALIESDVRLPDGAVLRVVESGTPAGGEVVFIHGFATSHAVWHRQLRSPQLRASCRMIAFDLLGHGASSASDEPRRFSPDAMADDFAALLDARGLRRPVVVAWSYGGRMINAYLRKYGQSRIAAVNYVAAASINDASLIGPSHTLLSQICDDDAALNRQAAEAFVGEIFGAAADPSDVARWIGVVTDQPPSVKRAMRAQPLDFDAMLPTIGCPVVASHGLRDRFMMPALSIRLAQCVRDGRASLYEDSGHAPFLDGSERFNQELAALVQQAQSGPGAP